MSPTLALIITTAIGLICVIPVFAMIVDLYCHYTRREGTAPPNKFSNSIVSLGAVIIRYVWPLILNYAVMLILVSLWNGVNRFILGPVLLALLSTAFLVFLAGRLSTNGYRSLQGKTKYIYAFVALVIPTLACLVAIILGLLRALTST